MNQEKDMKSLSKKKIKERLVELTTALDVLRKEKQKFQLEKELYKKYFESQQKLLDNEELEEYIKQEKLIDGEIQRRLENYDTNNEMKNCDSYVEKDELIPSKEQSTAGELNNLCLTNKEEIKIEVEDCAKDELNGSEVELGRKSVCEETEQIENVTDLDYIDFQQEREEEGVCSIWFDFAKFNESEAEENKIYFKNENYESHTNEIDVDDCVNDYINSELDSSEDEGRICDDCNLFEKYNCYKQEVVRSREIEENEEITDTCEDVTNSDLDDLQSEVYDERVELVCFGDGNEYVKEATDEEENESDILFEREHMSSARKSLEEGSYIKEDLEWLTCKMNLIENMKAKVKWKWNRVLKKVWIFDPGINEL